MHPSSRGFVWWVMALALAAALVVAFVPAFGYSTEELLGERKIKFDCPEGQEKCTVVREDLEWMLQRERLLYGMVQWAGKKLQQCSGGRDT